MIIANTLNGGWRALLKKVYETGWEVAPRGQKTKELIGESLRLTDPLSNLLTNPIRDLNPRFAVAEWLWIQGGMNDVSSIARYNGNISQYSDDGEIFAGAYGPRLLRQWDFIVETLRRDPDSRQAIVVIFSENPAPSKDVPCTLTLQWFIRTSPRSSEQKALYCVATMRSSDLWLGLPYDVFNFTMITNTLSAELELPVGGFQINLGSAHIYSQNFEKVEEIIKDPPPSRIVDLSGGQRKEREGGWRSEIPALRTPQLTSSLHELGRNGYWERFMLHDPDSILGPKIGSTDVPVQAYEYAQVLLAPTKKQAWEELARICSQEEL